MGKLKEMGPEKWDSDDEAQWSRVVKKVNHVPDSS
jgi:hypothetical protein